MIKRFGTLVLGCMLALGTAFALAGCATQDYTPQGKEPVVAPDVIIEKGVLRVGVNTENNTPFAGQVSGKIVGLDVDVAAALADSLGLKLELVDVGADVDSALENKQVDIVMGIDRSSTQVSCWRSEAYVESAVALFGQTATTTLPTTATAVSQKIAAQSSSMSAWEVRNQFGDDALSATDDLKGAFDQLTNGRAVYVAADAVIGTYAAYTADADVHIVGLMQNPSGYCIGVLDSNADLKSTISDTLATLSSNGMIPIIEKKWLGTALSLADLPKTEGASRTTTNTQESQNTSNTKTTDTDTDVPTGDNSGNAAVSDSSEIEAGGNAVQQPGTGSGDSTS